MADRTTLILMALAALAGVGIVEGEHIVRGFKQRYREWRLERRLARGDGACFEELRSLQAHPPADAPDAHRLPRPWGAIALAALFAFMVWAWRDGREKQFAFYSHLAVAIVAIWALYRIVERRTDPGPLPSGEEKEKLEKELFREGAALVMAMFYLLAGWFGH